MRTRLLFEQAKLGFSKSLQSIFKGVAFNFSGTSVFAEKKSLSLKKVPGESHGSHPRNRQGSPPGKCSGRASEAMDRRRIESLVVPIQDSPGAANRDLAESGKGSGRKAIRNFASPSQGIEGRDLAQFSKRTEGRAGSNLVMARYGNTLTVN